ncbi:MAG: S8 family serine peptidase [Clostridiales bacterium]|nr:S8 family serine peptidase [Clostridiales bacterium]
MKKFRFILSILLVLCMVLSMAMPAFAEMGTKARGDYDGKKLESREVSQPREKERPEPQGPQTRSGEPAGKDRGEVKTLSFSDFNRYTGMDKAAYQTYLAERRAQFESRGMGSEAKSAALGSRLRQQAITDKMTSMRLDPEEEVRAIVIFEGKAAAELSTDTGSRAFRDRASRIQADQENFKKDVASFAKIERNFSVLVNGLSLTTQAKNLKDIAAMPGVKGVYLANKYAAPAPVAKPFSDESASNAMTGADWLIENGYTGDGMIVAVLDTGMDVAHAVFQPNDLMLNPKLGPGDIGGTTEYGVYVNAKVPFAADYYNHDGDPYEDFSGHGTHVSGIAVGYAETDDGGIAFIGAAPAAQLLAMAVFDSDTGYTWSDVYFAAYEDAFLLGADVINCSFGSTAGFTYDDEVDDILGGIYEIMDAAGIVVCISAGNSGNMADDGLNWISQGYGIRAIRESATDYGMVGSPSTYTGNLSTASVEATSYQSWSNLFDFEGGTPIASANGDSTDFFGIITPGSWDLVAVPGLGYATDYAGIDVSGKIALIMRGDIAFTEKVDNAAANGAIAAIIYNDGRADQSLIGMLDTEYCAIPSIFVNNVSGLLLLDSLTIFISEEWLMIESDNPAAWLISDFSSWGTTSDLKFKPNISAPGGMIYSSIPGGGYASWSGTSMASPNLAGNFAGILQYLYEDIGITDKDEAGKLAEAIALSTAMILYDQYGIEYSPRAQGAGFINSAAAISTPVYLTNPTFELGDDPAKTGVYTLEVELQNLTAADQIYTIEDPVVLCEYLINVGDIYNTTESDYLDAILTTDVVFPGRPEVNPGDANCDGRVLAGDAAHIMRALANIAGTVLSPQGALNAEVDGDTSAITAGDATVILRYLCGLTNLPPYQPAIEADDRTFIVPANGSVTVTLTISLTAGSKAFLNAYRENGGFVDGFVSFTSITGAPELHASFMGFYGDWTDSPMLEKYDHGDILDALYLLDMLDLLDDFGPEDVLDDLQVGFNVAAGNGPRDGFYMGANLFELIPYNPEHNAVTGYDQYWGESLSDADYSKMWWAGGYPMLMRNARRVIMVVSDAVTGEVYTVDSGDEYIRKSVYDNRYGWESMVNYWWDGGIYDWQNGETHLDYYTDAFVPSGTKANIAYYAWLDYEEDAEILYQSLGGDFTQMATAMADYEVWSYPVTVDYISPTVASWNIVGNTMTVNLADAHYIMGAYTHDGNWNDDGRGVFSTPDTLGGGATLVIDISGGLDNLYLDVADYATNWPTYWYDSVEDEWVLSEGQSNDWMTIDEARFWTEDLGWLTEGMEITTRGWVSYVNDTELFLTALLDDMTPYDYSYGIAVELAAPEWWIWQGDGIYITGEVGVDAHGNPALVNAFAHDEFYFETGYDWDLWWEWDFEYDIGDIATALAIDYAVRYTVMDMDYWEDGLYYIADIASAGDGYYIKLTDGTAYFEIKNAPEYDVYGDWIGDWEVGDMIGGYFEMCWDNGNLSLHCYGEDDIWFCAYGDGTYPEPPEPDWVTLILDTNVEVSIFESSFVYCRFTAGLAGTYTFTSLNNGALDPVAMYMGSTWTNRNIINDDINYPSNPNYQFQRVMAAGETFNYISTAYDGDTGTYDVLVTYEGDGGDGGDEWEDIIEPISLTGHSSVLVDFTSPTNGYYAIYSSGGNGGDPIALAEPWSGPYGSQYIFGDDEDYSHFYFEIYLAEGEYFYFYADQYSSSRATTYNVIIEMIEEFTTDAVELTLNVPEPVDVYAPDYFPVKVSFTADEAGDYTFTSSNNAGDPIATHGIGIILNYYYGAINLWEEVIDTYLGDDELAGGNYQFTVTLNADETFTYFHHDWEGGTSDITVTKEGGSTPTDPLLGDWYFSINNVSLAAPTGTVTVYLTNTSMGSGKYGVSLTPTTVFTIEASDTPGKYYVKVGSSYLLYDPTGGTTNFRFSTTKGTATNTDFTITGSGTNKYFSVGGRDLKLSTAGGTGWDTPTGARWGAYVATSAGYYGAIIMTPAP